MSEENESFLEEGIKKPSVVKNIFTWLVVILVLAGGAGGFHFLKSFGPEAKKEEVVTVPTVVRVMEVSVSDHLLTIETQGRVVPERRTQAAAEVMGRIINVSKNFKVGGVFKKGETMLELDGADYESALANAKATLADAKLALEQEEARAEQARRDWEKLGRGQASDLVLRKPQIVSAKARIVSAEAAIAKAERDLIRTKLLAPYDCRVEATYTDLGSYVSPGMRLADLYSLHEYEIRLPVTLEDIGYLKEEVSGSKVKLRANLAGKMRSWDALITRSEGDVDQRTVMVHYIATIQPNANDARFSLPPVGLVLNAEIIGRELKGVIEIPRSTLREDGTVLLVDDESQLRVKKVTPYRTLEKTVLLEKGIESGTKLITNQMEFPIDGMEVEVVKESEQKDTPN